MVYRHALSTVLTICLLGILLAACQGDLESRKRAFLESGDRRLAEKNYQAAIIAYRNAIKEDPRFGAARLKLAQVYVTQQDWHRARAEAVHAADLLPQDVEAQVTAASVLLRFSEFADAKERARRALKLDPRNVQAYLVRGAAAAGLRDFNEAVTAYEEGLVADPSRTELLINIGTLRVMQGERAEAEGSFLQAVAVNPKSIQARLALANFFWWTGRTAAAEQAIQEALSIAPDDVGANRALASFYLANDRRADAEAPLRRAAMSEDPSPRLLLADYLVFQGRQREAIAVLDELVSNPAVFAQAAARRAGIDFETGQRDAAYAQLEQILVKHPRNVEVIVLKGKWLLSENQLDQAVATADVAIAADREFSPAHELRGAALVKQYRYDEAASAFQEAIRVNPRAVYAQAALSELHVIEGRHDAAVSFAHEAVQAAPMNGMARYVLARALLGKGDTRGARIELQPVLAGSPNAPQVHALLGNIEAKEGNVDAARAAYHRALSLDPFTLDAVTGLVRLDVAAQRTAEAVARITDYLRKKGDNAHAFYVAAETHLAAGDLWNAEIALRNAIALNARFAQAYHRLADVYLQADKFQYARQAYDRLIEVRPNDVSALSMIAVMHHAQKDTAEAKRAYQRVLAVDPRAAVAANNLAYLYAESGENLDIALSLAQMAKAAQPDDPDVNDTLGLVYLRRKLPALAREPLEQSVKANPRNATSHYHLGQAYLQLGERAKARAAFEQALRLDPAFENAAEVRKALAEIQ